MRNGYAIFWGLLMGALCALGGALLLGCIGAVVGWVIGLLFGALIAHATTWRRRSPVPRPHGFAVHPTAAQRSTPAPGHDDDLAQLADAVAARAKKPREP
jgi:predicted lipid-binding transport protein (Tim44 family)